MTDAERREDDEIRDLAQRQLDRSGEPFGRSFSERGQVSAERFNGRWQLRIRRGVQSMVVPVSELANLAAAVDEGLTWICEREARGR